MAVLTESARIREYGICSGITFSTVFLSTSAVKAVPFLTNAALVPAWEVFAEILRRWEYWVDPTQTGSYNCRHIGNDPKRPWSPHASGSAFDINWRRNPVSYPIKTDIPRAMVADIVSVRTVSGKQVFRWGADWDTDGSWTDHSFIDPMHFEIIAEMADLETGIIDPGGSNVLKSGDSGRAVKRFQTYLERAGYDLVIDGVYGPGTASAVSAFQTAEGLEATGILDAISASILSTYGASIVLPGHAPDDHGPHLTDEDVIDIVAAELID